MSLTFKYLWIVSFVATACAVEEPPRMRAESSAVATRYTVSQSQTFHTQTDWQCVTTATFNSTIEDLQGECIDSGGQFDWDVIGTGTDVLNGAVLCRDDQYAIEYSCTR